MNLAELAGVRGGDGASAPARREHQAVALARHLCGIFGEQSVWDALIELLLKDCPRDDREVRS